MPKKKQSCKFRLTSKLIINQNQDPPERILNFCIVDEFDIPDIKECINMFFLAYAKKLYESSQLQMLLASSDLENNTATYFIGVHLYKFHWEEIK